ncbi:hypothetical protein [Saccharothrix texasensis]|uniref:PemK-like, MazF-like toxin of type II toxin-antitoxin system n=1 Tax=Saccharothrix texasensis TaxID=103734 RepID=A0A3N1H0Q3_9PSEU|nr:hypothetical protein [Saccharothrix texasensis]ROP36064.1 hypothetical protein EDD40_1325 [Saccharothrix texasensis]
MAAKHVGMIMKHDHERVVVLRVELTHDGADAVMVAPLVHTAPAGDARAVKVKTWVDDYWVRLDRTRVVKAADVVHAWTGPGQLRRPGLTAVLKELR